MSDRLKRGGSRSPRAKRSKFDKYSPNGRNSDRSNEDQYAGEASAAASRFSLNASNFGTTGAGPIIPTNYDLASRKIYVGGIATHHTDNEIAQFLGQTLQRAGACIEPGNPIMRTNINRDKRYLFVELRTAEEAAALMQLDGIDY